MRTHPLGGPRLRDKARVYELQGETLAVFESGRRLAPSHRIDLGEPTAVHRLPKHVAAWALARLGVGKPEPRNPPPAAAAIEIDRLRPDHMPLARASNWAGVEPSTLRREIGLGRLRAYRLARAPRTQFYTTRRDVQAWAVNRSS